MKDRVKGKDYMHISVIIPALNEEAHIERAILSASDADEVIVVDGGSNDATVSITEKLGAKVIISKKGRGVQQDAGAKEAKGDALLFLHADTMLPEGWKESVAQIFTDGNIVGGAFLLGINSDNPLLKFINRIANIRAKYLGLIYGDQAILVKKDKFFSIGGFRGLPIMEDVDLIRRLRRHGTVKLLKEKVLTSQRRWYKKGLISTTLKNWFYLFLYYIGVSPERIYRLYYKRP
ncbi:MAG TPA: glycosyltransferase [Deltaproteobacteria bacterium]|nr:glycosyltransferase [Deltaproteobacteria bacterium]